MLKENTPGKVEGHIILTFIRLITLKFSPIYILCILCTWNDLFLQDEQRVVVSGGGDQIK